MARCKPPFAAVLMSADVCVMHMRPAALIAALLMGSCQEPAAPPVDGTSILFVGNSLTEVNDLPATIRAIAHAAGDTVRVGSATAGGTALIDHINGATDAVQQIRRGHWKFVVLQQGPTTTGGVCLDSFMLWTAKFDTIIRGSGATTALFSVWPIGGSPAGFDAVHASYLAAARSVNGIFLPAGDAWRAAWAVDASLPFYGGDTFHPAPLGSYLAALVIYESLTGRDARTLPQVAYDGGVAIAGITAQKIQILQNAAHQAVVAAAALPAPPALPRPRSAPRSC